MVGKRECHGLYWDVQEKYRSRPLWLFSQMNNWLWAFLLNLYFSHLRFAQRGFQDEWLSPD